VGPQEREREEGMEIGKTGRRQGEWRKGKGSEEEGKRKEREVKEGERAGRREGEWGKGE